MELPAWTYSQLEGFETCPKQFYAVRVARTIPYVQGVAARWGDDVHIALENRVKHGTVLPAGMTQWEQLVNKVTAMPGIKITEGQYAIDKNFTACGYKDKAAWSRGKIDLTTLSTSSALVLDWKTGKRKPTEQLDLYAGYIFAAHPEIKRVHTAFVWLRDKKMDKATIEKAEMPERWQRLLARYRRIEIAYEKNVWPAKPSGLCRQFCPVTACEFHGR